MALPRITDNFKKSCLCILMLLVFLIMYFNYTTTVNIKFKVKVKGFSYVMKTLVLNNGTKDEFVFKYQVFPALDGVNQARMSPERDPVTREILTKDDFGLFHIVTTFVPYDNKDVRKNLFIDGKPPTDQEIEARMAEFTDCLQRNLNHYKISFVHVLVLRNETISYLQSLNLQNSQKLVIHKNDVSPTMLQKLMYASSYLKKKTVILSHQDNYIGEGFEKVNHDVLKGERLMYALTRHASPSKCFGTMASAHCGEGYPYLGSHDIFIYYVNESLTYDKLVELDVTPNLNGMENVLIWIFQTRLAYRVINPCKVLIVYHTHCVPIRDGGRKRINGGGKNGGAQFTDKLQ